MLVRRVSDTDAEELHETPTYRDISTAPTLELAREISIMAITLTTSVIVRNHIARYDRGANHYICISN